MLKGNQVRSVCLSEGERLDMKILPKLLERGNWKNVSGLIGDKGYDYPCVRRLIAQRGHC